MLKRLLAMALVAGLGAWVVTSCSGYNSSSTTAKSGVPTLFSFAGDVPFCGILNFRISVSGLSLTPQGGGTDFAVFPSAARSPIYKVNFGQMKDFSTLMDLGPVAPGTYTVAKVAVSGPQLAGFDPTKDPPVQAIGVLLPNSTIQVPIDPPLVVAPGAIVSLRFDLDIRRSIQVGADGQVTNTLVPVMTATPLTASPTGGFGEMDDMLGFITSVTTTPTSGTAFIGGFGFQTLSGTGPLVTANLTSATQICGAQTASNQTCTPVALNALLTGSFVELDGYVDANGNLVANTVEVEDQEIPEQNQNALVGYVLPGTISRDSSGNVTQFSFDVNEEEPDAQSHITLDSIVVVNVSPSTVYQFSGRSANFAMLPFDATAITPGQELVVSGVFSVPPTSNPPPTVLPPTTVAAGKVYLKLQSHQGNFRSIASAQADDRTGAFWLTSCSTLFGGAPILVLTQGSAAGGFVATSFVGVGGLGELTPQPLLLVKGLLFYERAAQTVNGVAVPAGTLVLVAKEVHQLQ